jgi:hypothetical protein
MMSVVEALRGDLEDGFIGSISELIRAEVFGNYLDMADHLLDEGYKDPAAVVAGSTLEAHLRQLCAKHGIDVTRVNNGKIQHKRAGELNQDLGRSVYSGFDQKQITAWQNLRNDAAHGHYEAYSADDVERFVGGLRDFVARHPA